ncbi:hypothetical protein ACM66B_005995 [Microbotryomycetes sp. NB124-2]
MALYTALDEIFKVIFPGQMQDFASSKFGGELEVHLRNADAVHICRALRHLIDTCHGELMHWAPYEAFTGGVRLLALAAEIWEWPARHPEQAEPAGYDVLRPLCPSVWLILLNPLASAKSQLESAPGKMTARVSRSAAMDGSSSQPIAVPGPSHPDSTAQPPLSSPRDGAEGSTLRRTFARFSAGSPSRQSVFRSTPRSSPARSRAASKSGSISVSPPTDASSSSSYPPRASSSMSTTLSDDDTTPNATYQGGASLSRPFTAPQPSTAFAASASSLAAQAVPTTVLETENDTGRQPIPATRPHRPRAASSTALPRLAPPQHTPATSRPSSTSPSPANLSLQSVLFNGLLNATLSDLNLVAFNRFYRLHRIVLAGQSGFFNSLLSGGFAEQQVHSSRRNSDMIAIELMPPMQRNAFEFCLARLYGGGPDLVPPSWAQATPQSPLSAMFEALHQVALGTEVRNPDETHSSQFVTGAPPNSLSATPGFLLSLLACAVYLEMPYLVNTALDTIQNSLTPWTVTRFLAHACGEHSPDDETPSDEPCPGLEHVGHELDDDDAADSTLHSGSYASSTADGPSEHPTMFVGPEGERVGEACACWLAKWGSDILHVEEWLASRPPDEDEADFVRQALTAHEMSLASMEPAPPPLRVWSSNPGGLSARWVRGIISSDAFFVPFSNTLTPNDAEIDLDSLDLGTDGEFQRYLFAKRVVQLRRNESLQRQRAGLRAADELAESMQDATLQDSLTASEVGHDVGDTSSELDDVQKCGARLMADERLLEEKVELDDDDEAEYDELFASGIHYSHMSFRQLQYVAADVCIITGKPFVRQSIVERALWESEAFKIRIPTTPTSRLNYHAAYGSTRSPGQETMVDERPELGLVSQINPARTLRDGDDSRPYYLLPVDDTTRINEKPSINSETPENAAEVAPAPATPKKPSTLPRGPNNFFGLALETRPGTVGPVASVYGSADEVDRDRRWVAHEPCRVSIEFWGVQALKDKQRLYSSTFFYAGSFYNLYLQKIQKKGSLQLGIYLHRQNPSEPFPVPSQPPPSATSLHKSRATAPSLAPYTDRRKQIRAFFSIWCPTHLGTSLTKFSSGPDSFALSQSWGWKSTSLSQEFLGSVTGVPEPSETTSVSSSLRVTIVMGIV